MWVPVSIVAVVLIVLLFMKQMNGMNIRMPVIENFPFRPIGWAVAGIIVLVFLWQILPIVSKSDVDVGFWIAMIAIAGLAVANLFFNKGGTAGSVAVWIVASGILMLLIFGDNITQVRSAIKNSATSAVLEGKQQTSTVSQRPVVVVQQLPQKMLVQLSDTWSEPVRVIGGRCIFFWQETPGVHRTELQLPNQSDWVTLDEFRRMGARKAERTRWSGSGTLGYEIRPDGQC